jgi:ABC-type uncharacterized transport system fused permease/ATPase subunit
MTLGTLRDQVIYPDTVDDQTRKEMSDEIIGEYLKKVKPIDDWHNAIHEFKESIKLVPLYSHI